LGAFGVKDTPVFFSSATGSKVNRAAGVIEGVSVITEGEAKGHGVFIDQTTLEQVKACAEQFSDGVQVKVNHGAGFDSIVGVLRNFRIDGQKLLADLHLLKNHEMRDRLFEIAEELPGSIGLSIAFSGGSEKIKGREYARCAELYSVDFVDRPAANPSGLFQRVDSPPNGMADNVSPEKTLLEQIKGLLGISTSQPVNFEAKAKELETQLSAKATEFAAIQAKVTELEAANAKITTELEAAKKAVTEFDAKVETSASAKAQAIMAQLGIPPQNGGTGSAGKKDFASLVAQIQAERKVSKGQAVELCVKEHPEAHAEWRKSGNTATL
jgi:hypothetical protein